METNIIEESERVDTTIGELIATITEVALETGKSEEEGYHLASIAVEAILRKKTEKFNALMQ